MLTYAILSNFVFLGHFALFYFFACVINYYTSIFNVESVAVFLPHNFMELSSLPSAKFHFSSPLFGNIVKSNILKFTRQPGGQSDMV